MLLFKRLLHSGRKRGGSQGERSLAHCYNLIITHTRSRLKSMYNPYFGSIFRTEKAPTYFSRRLNRFASLYMPSLESFQDYVPDHTFYPRRAALPHEVDLNFDLID